MVKQERNVLYSIDTQKLLTDLQKMFIDYLVTTFENRLNVLNLVAKWTRSEESARKKSELNIRKC